MKRIFSVACILLLNSIVKAQTITSFHCAAKVDSVYTVYQLEVGFDKQCTEEQRQPLVLKELEKNYNILPDSIVSIKSWIGKRYRTYLYHVKVKK